MAKCPGVLDSGPAAAAAPAGGGGAGTLPALLCVAVVLPMWVTATDCNQAQPKASLCLRCHRVKTRHDTSHAAQRAKSTWSALF